MKREENTKYLFGLIFLLENRLQILGNRYLRKDGLTTKQWLLMAITSQYGQNSPKLTEVAEDMGSSRQNVKQIAIKLEEKGFLNMERDKKDSRIVRINNTKKSKLFWENREKEDDKFIERLFEGIDDEKLEAMKNGFEKLFDNIENI